MKWIIKSYMAKQHIDSISELAKAVGMTRRILYDRINHPETFRLYELRALADVLKITDEDLMAVMRGNG